MTESKVGNSGGRLDHSAIRPPDTKAKENPRTYATTGGFSSRSGGWGKGVSGWLPLDVGSVGSFATLCERGSQEPPASPVAFGGDERRDPGLVPQALPRFVSWRPTGVALVHSFWVRLGEPVHALLCRALPKKSAPSVQPSIGFCMSLVRNHANSRGNSPSFAPLAD